MHQVRARRLRTSPASAALVATALPPKAVRRPARSVNTPPASSMIGWRQALRGRGESESQVIAQMVEQWVAQNQEIIRDAAATIQDYQRQQNHAK